MGRRIALVLEVMLCVAVLVNAQGGATLALNSAYAEDTLALRELLKAAGADSTPVDAVTKQVNGRIAWLDLSNKDATKSGVKVLSARIGELTGLEVLLLQKNSLASLPEEMSGLTRLRVLNLGDNDLALLPPWIGKLQQLDTLDVRNNEFDSLPSELYKLKKLRYLQAWGNRLTTLPEDIANMTGLRELYVQRNRLASLPKSILKMKNLTYIDYGYNNICAPSPDIEAWLKEKDKMWHQWQNCR
jgi:hypothetical protein